MDFDGRPVKVVGRRVNLNNNINNNSIPPHHHQQQQQQQHYRPRSSSASSRESREDTDLLQSSWHSSSTGTSLSQLHQQRHGGGIFVGSSVEAASEPSSALSSGGEKGGVGHFNRSFLGVKHGLMSMDGPRSGSGSDNNNNNNNNDIWSSSSVGMAVGQRGATASSDRLIGIGGGTGMPYNDTFPSNSGSTTASTTNNRSRAYGQNFHQIDNLVTSTSAGTSSGFGVFGGTHTEAGARGYTGEDSFERNTLKSTSAAFYPRAIQNDSEPLQCGPSSHQSNHTQTGGPSSLSLSSRYDRGIVGNSPTRIGTIGQHSSSSELGFGGATTGQTDGSSSLFRPSSPFSSSLVHGTFDYRPVDDLNNSSSRQQQQMQQQEQEQSHHHGTNDSSTSSMHTVHLDTYTSQASSSKSVAAYNSYGSRQEQRTSSGVGSGVIGSKSSGVVGRDGWKTGGGAGDGGSLPGVVGASSGSTIGGVSSSSTTTMGFNPWEYGSGHPNTSLTKSGTNLVPNSSRFFPTQQLYQEHDQQNDLPGLNLTSHREHDQRFPKQRAKSPWQRDTEADSSSLPSYNTNTSYDDLSRYTCSTNDEGSYHRDNYGQQQRTRAANHTGRGRGRGRFGRGRHSLRHPTLPTYESDGVGQVQKESTYLRGDESFASSKASSEAVRMLMNPAGSNTNASWASSSNTSVLKGSRLHLDRLNDPFHDNDGSARTASSENNRSILRPILPAMEELLHTTEEDEENDEDGMDDSQFWADESSIERGSAVSPSAKKREWLLRMNRRLAEIPVGELDPSTTPISAIMNGWAKTKSAQGASMVETWLKRAQQEYDAGNTRIVPTNKMFTMAVDAWAKSNEGVSAAQRAEAILQYMHQQFQNTGLESLRPTTGIFNAVINAWARSNDKMAPTRAEQILKWMDNLHLTHPSIQADKYSYNTVIHSFSRVGGPAAAKKALELLSTMQLMYEQGNQNTKPDTITYNVVINSMAKSGGKGAALEAEKILAKMHQLHEDGDPDVKPNVISYGAVIDAYAKSGEKGAATRADALLARMIQLHQMDPMRNADMAPNTYVFNTVINCHSKSREPDAPSKAEEMLQAMNRLHASGMPNIKPDAFTYTAVIDAWAKSGHRGAASRADQLLDTMESKYLAGEVDLRPNTFTYNAVIQALAKSGEPGAAARAERVLHNMVNRHRHGASDDVKPTTINFNSVLDAYAKSGGGRKAAERAEEILQWMDRLYNAGGNDDIKPDTITFNAVIDAWARSGDRMAAQRAEQILDHMDDLYRAGNHGVKPDVYTYNTLINCHSKSKEKGAAERAEHVLQVMKQRFMDGDKDFKPNTRSHTSVIDAIAKSGEKHAARRAEHILNTMITSYEETGDPDIKPNVHTANAVCNACAFTKMEDDRSEALQIAFRVFDWLSSQSDMEPDAYTFTILLSVCANLLPREDRHARFSHAKAFFDKCCSSGYVNDYVLRKLRQAVTEEEYYILLGQVGVSSTSSTSSFVSLRQLPSSWSRKVSNNHSKISNSTRRDPGQGEGGRGGGRGGGGSSYSSHHRRRGGG